MCTQDIIFVYNFACRWWHPIGYFLFSFFLLVLLVTTVYFQRHAYLAIPLCFYNLVFSKVLLNLNFIKYKSHIVSFLVLLIDSQIMMIIFYSDCRPGNADNHSKTCSPFFKSFLRIQTRPPFHARFLHKSEIFSLINESYFHYWQGSNCKAWYGRRRRSGDFFYKYLWTRCLFPLPDDSRNKSKTTWGELAHKKSCFNQYHWNYNDIERH